jgi:hypothetical protein
MNIALLEPLARPTAWIELERYGSGVDRQSRPRGHREAKSSEREDVPRDGRLRATPATSASDETTRSFGTRA